MAEVAAPHSPAHEQAAALYALRLLESEELADFQAHLADCSRCQQLVAADLETLEVLIDAAPAAPPPPGFRARMVGRIDRELAESQPAWAPPPLTVIHPAPRRSVTLHRLAAPLVAILLLALGFLVGREYVDRQVLANIPLQSIGAQGTVSVVLYGSGAADLELQGLPDPPTGQVYQSWVVQPDGRRLSAGMYDEGTGSYHLDQPFLGHPMEITLEPAPGSEAPTSAPLYVWRIGS
jgi:anti-sigma-K factor RskA